MQISFIGLARPKSIAFPGRLGARGWAGVSCLLPPSALQPDVFFRSGIFATSSQKLREHRRRRRTGVAEVAGRDNMLLEGAGEGRRLTEGPRWPVLDPGAGQQGSVVQPGPARPRACAQKGEGPAPHGQLSAPHPPTEEGLGPRRPSGPHPRGDTGLCCNQTRASLLLLERKTSISLRARSTLLSTTAASEKGGAPSPQSWADPTPEPAAPSGPRTANRVQPSSESRCREPEPLRQSQAHCFLRPCASQARFAMNPELAEVLQAGRKGSSCPYLPALKGESGKAGLSQRRNSHPDPAMARSLGGA